MYERLQPKGLTGKILVVWIADHFGGRTWSLVCISTIDALQLVSCAESCHAVEERTHEKPRSHIF